MTAEIRIIAVNLPDRLALASDDRVCPITNLYDDDGDETDDEDEAVAAVARWDESHWFSIVLSDYDRPMN